MEKNGTLAKYNFRKGNVSETGFPQGNCLRICSDPVFNTGWTASSAHSTTNKLLTIAAFLSGSKFWVIFDGKLFRQPRIVSYFLQHINENPNFQWPLIPTGTIKSISMGNEQRFQSLFQFLLVRLKVLLLHPAQFLRTISIPTGTIKRMHISGRSKAMRYFNSYWYD